MSHIDRYNQLPSQQIKPRSRSRKSRPNGGGIDNRPPWNNDTYIEGYDDVDEHGKYRKRGAGAMPKAPVKQEELTREWEESLREKHHQH